MLSSLVFVLLIAVLAPLEGVQTAPMELSPTHSSSAVEAPRFDSPVALAEYVHHMLRTTNDEATLRANLIPLMAPRFFDEEDGEQVLDSRGQILIDNVVDRALLRTGTYVDQGCETPIVNPDRTRDEYVHYHGILHVPPRANINETRSHILSIEAFEVSGGYRNGQPLPPHYLINNITVDTSDNPDDIAYLASFDDLEEVCRELIGSAVGSRREVAPESRDRVGDTVRQGRRRLGRILGGN